MKATDVLAHADALFLDFDGPVCSVFAGIPASMVADQLRSVLADGGHTDLPEPVATSTDPFDIFSTPPGSATKRPTTSKRPLPPMKSRRSAAQYLQAARTNS
jgi:hypothetical protein